MTKEQFLSKYRHRSYIHFDQPFRSKELAYEYANHFRNGKPHSFLPLLGFTKNVHRIKRDKEDITIPHRLREVEHVTKKRLIKYASHKDTAIYTYYGIILSSLYESKVKELNLGENITAFREATGKNNIHHAKDVFDFISAKAPCVALAFDITSFFDHLDHKILFDNWLSLLNVKSLPKDHYKVYQSLTRFTWTSSHQAFKQFCINPLNPRPHGENRSRICTPSEFRNQIIGQGLLQKNPYTHKGIPQGSPMSAVLSNIYMLGFDEYMNQYAQTVGGLYRRYCDDIMLVVPWEHEREARLKFYLKVRSIKLKTNKSKTDIAHFNNETSVDGKTLQYLGFLFNGNRILLRQGSLDRYYGKMRKAVTLAGKSQLKESLKKRELLKLKRRKLDLHYSHLISSQRGGKKSPNSKMKRPFSRQNFITYAHRSSKIMNSPAIKQQIRGHWFRLKKAILKRERVTKAKFVKKQK